MTVADPQAFRRREFFGRPLGGWLTAYPMARAGMHGFRPVYAREEIMTWTAMQRTFVLAAMLGLTSTIPVAAQTSEVKVGLIAPISGPWARQGELMLKGANLAIDDINREGGIRTLGRRQAEAHRVRRRRQRREGEERRPAHGRAGARPDRRHRRLAVELHARRHRGDRACRAADADAVLLGSDHLLAASSTCSRPRPPAALRPTAPCRPWSSWPRAPPARSRRRSPSSWTTRRRR